MVVEREEVERKIIEILRPLDKVVDNLEGIVHDAIDRIPEYLPPAPKRVLFKAEHESLAEAIAADIIEHLPVVGPALEAVGNFFRIRDAARRGETNTATRQMIDVILPLPTNTRRYIKKALGKPIT